MSANERPANDSSAPGQEAETEAPLHVDPAAAAAAYARTGAEAEQAAAGAEPAADPQLAAENKDLRDQVLRTLAEMENLRRRTAREKEDTAKYAVGKFAKDLLSVADNLSRALQAIPEGAGAADPLLQTLADGVGAIERELAAVLERHGVTAIDALGRPFDSNLHQAVMEQPTDAVPPGHVAQVFQTGYLIADRLLRPAMVAVAKAP